MDESFGLSSQVVEEVARYLCQATPRKGESQGMVLLMCWEDGLTICTPSKVDRVVRRSKYPDSTKEPTFVQRISWFERQSNENPVSRRSGEKVLTLARVLVFQSAGCRVSVAQVWNPECNCK